VPETPATSQPTAPTPQAGEPTLRIQLYKSPIGYSSRQRATVRSLGLRRMHQVVVQRDTPAMRGMLARVPHLVRIVEEEAPVR
jgi:large subunit ribosomal protein L30